jgi:3-mercaptopyruvate sulfurtransferase SseA
LLGGWAAWLQAGYPVEGTAVPAPTATASARIASEEMTVLGSADAPVTILEFSDFQ